MVPFSPLFIGEYSATLSCQCDACKRYIFQSPLHRGILCNQKRGSRRSGVGGALSVPSSSGNTLQRQPGFVIAKTRIVLSVPSSSGNTLQRSRGITARSRSLPFSPLFIGEYSATIQPPCGKDQKKPFQSPLHRGILCNRCAPS